ncbi:uncharacterized protein LOC105030150 [Esox lucius]|uniref:uncharacterized protein LOC105030150 n=1 Tax=Esox lucius TaxID=8010 RepID=UPI0014771DAC|nr:uncharacterized protein LOC105030150 [Esox lucius]
MDRTEIQTLKYPVFTLEGKVPAVSRGDDSGEVSSLSGEQRSDWLGPSALRLVQGDSSGPVSWQTESSLAESWSTVGDMDPEDSRSLDNLTEERSEDHYSISDMLHLEQDAEEEDEEMLSEEEDGSLAEVEEELQASVMSVLGGERELAELREEELAGQAVLPSSEVSARQQVPQTSDPPPSVERRETWVQEEPAAVSHTTTAPMPMPVWRLEPPSASSTPVPSVPTLAELHSELQYSMQEQLHPPPVLGPGAPQPPDTSQTTSQALLPAAQATQEVLPSTQVVPPEKADAEPATSTSDSELPVLLCAGAALVAVVGIVAYGAMAYCRK